MSTTGTHRHPARQCGLALVMVLWLLVLMTVIASSHSSNIRTETRLAFNHVETTKARHLAEAGLNHALLELLANDHSNEQHWKLDGSVHKLTFEQGKVRIALRDVRGLIDINKVLTPILEPVLIAAGMEDTRQRKALMGAIFDWRDRDNLKNIDGAEDDDYQRAGLKWSARDGAFTSVEEFRYILGMSNEVFEKLAPHLTVHSGQASVDAALAPPWLAQALVADRQLASAPGAQAPGDLSTCRISVYATTASGASASLEAVVRLEAGNQAPYRILSWRNPAWSTDALPG
jgi:general secretion pathway protein K